MTFLDKYPHVNPSITKCQHICAFKLLNKGIYHDFLLQCFPIIQNTTHTMLLYNHILIQMIVIQGKEKTDIIGSVASQCHIRTIISVFRIGSTNQNKPYRLCPKFCPIFTIERSAGDLELTLRILKLFYYPFNYMCTHLYSHHAGY